MQLWIGLGNPGADYAGHRHNIGFMAVDAIADAYRFPAWQRKFKGWVSAGTLPDIDPNPDTDTGSPENSRILLLKPATFMNESGVAARAALDFYKLAPEAVTVFHDELDLAPFAVRVKRGGGTAGHNGLRSLERHIGAAFRRVRIGIGHPGTREQVLGHVLGDFAKADHPALTDTLAAIAAAAPWLARGQEARFTNAIALALGA